MKVIEEAIAKKKDELRKAQIELAQLEDILKRVSGDHSAPSKTRAARSDVKTLVLRLLEEVGPAGLNAASAVELAEKLGKRLERGTVSSLLSRLKNDHAVKYDGTVYRLSKFGGGEVSGTLESRPAIVVHPFPASKSAS